jgi:hypothetical protein
VSILSRLLHQDDARSTPFLRMPFAPQRNFLPCMMTSKWQAVDCAGGARCCNYSVGIFDLTNLMAVKTHVLREV